ncbi:MAG: AbrB/MazE/SpoVT family DNA-binding domain-containing protein [Chloroflexi bacterium]|nr:AbrB/MazE/SpoVT family DNA-binding domain-containing protein [Chloroflexota bacterium]
MKTHVIMNSEGRLTVPAAVRKSLGLAGQSPLELEVADGLMLLRPAVIIPREDEWAYTPEHRALLARSQEDVRQGRVRQVSEADLERLGD